MSTACWRSSSSPSGGVGVVKFYAGRAVKKIARQLALAQERSPQAGLDLSALNATDPQVFFRKKES